MSDAQKPEPTPDDDKAKKLMPPGSSIGVGIALGVAIGAALGIALDNLALWLGVGIAIGSGLGVALNGATQAKKPEAGDDAADGSSDDPKA